MYETTRKYSEEQYCSKEEVEKDFQDLILENVWKQICEYRTIFRNELLYDKHQYYIILNPYVLKQMEACNQFIFKLQMYEKKKTIIPTIFTLYEQTRLLQIVQNPFHIRNDLRTILQVLDISVANTWISFLMVDEVSFLVKLCMLRYYPKESIVKKLMYAFLLIHHMEEYYSVFETSILPLYKTGSQIDVTYDVLDSLKKIMLKLSQGMVLLNGEQKSDIIFLHETAMKEQYPQLSPSLLHFFVNHREQYHYYTISQYMSCCNVCYETARYSLDELVKMKWYLKKKLGKKYVYYIVG